MKQYFFMKSNKYEDQDVGGWYCSEKIDGQTAFWDGGITAGMPKKEVPWANVDKDSRYKDEQFCTGLWSQNANIIHAPESWTRYMPTFPILAELWTGDRRVEGRQRLRSIVSTIHPDEYDWRSVCAMVFDIPSIEYVFRPRKIDTMHYKKVYTKYTQAWMVGHMEDYGIVDVEPWYPFDTIYKIIRKRLNVCENLNYIEQKKLSRFLYKQEVDEYLRQVLDAKGEGLMLRHPDMTHVTVRSTKSLKVKYDHDDEATIVGYTAGKGKLLGLMGNAIVDYKGRRLELSGFTDEERELFANRNINEDGDASAWCREHEGQEVPDWIYNPRFSRGTVITFKYRAMSSYGIPQEAKYWRKYCAA
jgi:hypothetical protein